jgi:hypothetical protein
MQGTNYKQDSAVLLTLKYSLLFFHSYFTILLYTIK